jgi:GNAT superfamily N-acetyltransferase
MSIEVRPATPDDMRFIHSSWVTCYFQKYARKHIDGKTYHAEIDEHINRLVARSVSIVAFETSVPDEVLGYAVLEGPTCHIVYVKSVYRRQGIGGGLVRGRCKWYSHETDPAGKDFARAVGMEFNPFRRNT